MCPLAVNEPVLLALQLAGGSIRWADSCSAVPVIVNFCDRIRIRTLGIKSITAEIFLGDQPGSPQFEPEIS